MSKCWGIDLGGTKIEGIVVPSKSSLEPICRIRVDTEGDQGYQHVLDQICHLVDQMTQAVGERPRAIGFSTPGVLDPKTNTLKNSNTLCLNGKPLKDALENRLNIRARLSNDANCFALAEALLGAGRGAPSVFGVILGTGVGGGVVVNGSVLDGCQGIGGEWGHNILYDQGEPCYCGKSGCVESFMSGPALERYYAKISGKHLKMRDIVKLSKAGESEAKATIDRLCTCFGRAITVIINILDPHAVVLGGGVSNVEELYTQGAAEIGKYIFNNRVETQIRKNQLGDSAGVFGAAMLI
jgi:fructokinase